MLVQKIPPNIDDSIINISALLGRPYRGASLLGCRLAFADRRKSQSAETLVNLAFAKLAICLLQNFNDGGGAHVNH